MRPDRAVVKKAIVDAGGNLSRAAILLACTRQTLYTWIYQHGLQRLAGVRMDRRIELDKRERLDGSVRPAGKLANKTDVSGVYSAGSDVPILSSVEQVIDTPVQATVRVPESLWKRVKIEAIRKNTTVAALVAAGLECVLEDSEQKNSKS